MVVQRSPQKLAALKKASFVAPRVYRDEDVDEAGRRGWISGPCDCFLSMGAALGDAIEGGAEQIVGLALLMLSGAFTYVASGSFRTLWADWLHRGSPSDERSAAAAPPPAPPSLLERSVRSSSSYAQVHPGTFVAVLLGSLVSVALLVLFEEDLRRCAADLRLRCLGYRPLEKASTPHQRRAVGLGVPLGGVRWKRDAAVAPDGATPDRAAGATPDGGAPDEAPKAEAPKAEAAAAGEAPSGVAPARAARLMRERTLRQELHRAVDESEALELQLLLAEKRGALDGQLASRHQLTLARLREQQARRETLREALSHEGTAASPALRPSRAWAERRAGLASCWAACRDSNVLLVGRRSLNGLVVTWLRISPDLARSHPISPDLTWSPRVLR